jgi:chromosome partitioning protein
MKGGVGKTTLTFNLAFYIAYHWNLRVLLIDLDPQANLSQYSMGAGKYLEYIEADKGTIIDIFEQFSSSKAKKIEPNDVIYSLRNFYSNSRNRNGIIDLVPSKLELAWTLKNPTEKAHLLYQFLEKADEINNYDLVLIDCAPTESILTTSAYIASDLIFVPVKPEFLATIGLPLLARSMDDFHCKYPKSKMQMGGIIFNGPKSLINMTGLSLKIMLIFQNLMQKVLGNLVPFFLQTMQDILSEKNFAILAMNLCVLSLTFLKMKLFSEKIFTLKYLEMGVNT